MHFALCFMGTGNRRYRISCIAKKKAKSGMATAGLVCSIIALAVWVVVIILLVVVGVSVGLAG